jgi:hypothetical protein
MDTEFRWHEMKSQLDDVVKPDYIRFNVSLKDVPCTIDNVGAMDECRNLVIRQPGSARMAREAATALLVSRFYFVLGSVPEDAAITTPLWCHGTIRCKGPVKQVLESLERLHPQNLDFITDSSPLGRFGGVEDICPTCERYCRPVAILIRHMDDVINIYLRINRKKRWRISGFPDSMATFVTRQYLHSPFGRPDHGHPGTDPCYNCDSTESSLRGKRRKRTSVLSREEQDKKRVCIVEFSKD